MQVQPYDYTGRFACIADNDVIPAKQNMVLFTIERAQTDSIRERTMAQCKYLVMSVEDYLILNRNSKDIRYEYLDGDIRMLAGEVLITLSSSPI
jgi:hypothetical protein